MSFIVLNCQVVEWVDIFANPVFKNPGLHKRPYWGKRAHVCDHYFFQQTQPASHQIFINGGQLTELEGRDQPPTYTKDEQVRVKSWVMFLLKLLRSLALSNNESDGNEVVQTRKI